VIGYEPDAPDDLVVPHPRLWYRRFVLDPLCEIAGEQFHPVQRCSLSTLRERLLPRPLPISVHAREPESADAVAAALLIEFPREICRVTAGGAAAGSASAVELRMVPRPTVSRGPRVAELPSDPGSSIPLARIVIRSALG
jgi:2-amino-4-hydroxy-6-hydroxymethyldihydropteridine diphosphokinase